MLSAFNNKNYNDIKLFLWLIPVINIINYYLTYTHIKADSHLVITFIIDTIEGYLAWLCLRAVIILLDKKMPYESGPYKRIAVQLLLTLIAGTGTIILLTELINYLTKTTPVPSSFYTQDIFIIAIWFFVVNGIYIGLHYFGQWQQSEQKRKEENQIKTGGFKVSTPKKDLLFTFEEINGFYIDSDYSIVVTIDGKKYFVDSSLDRVEKILPQIFFFRLNRQYIVHRQLVSGYEKGENGKINVLLKPNLILPAAIPVSRTKAPAFKRWLTPEKTTAS